MCGEEYQQLTLAGCGVFALQPRDALRLLRWLVWRNPSVAFPDDYYHNITGRYPAQALGERRSARSREVLHHLEPESDGQDRLTRSDAVLAKIFACG
jgi:hypothetical protein